MQTQASRGPAGETEGRDMIEDTIDARSGAGEPAFRRRARSEGGIPAEQLAAMLLGVCAGVVALATGLYSRSEASKRRGADTSRFANVDAAQAAKVETALETLNERLARFAEAVRASADAYAEAADRLQQAE
jgi:hypothetical protein